MKSNSMRLGKPGIGQLVAQRTLIEAIGDDTRNVVVSLLAPQRRKDGTWECPYRVDGRKEPIVGSSIGEDSLQALMTGVQALRMALESTGGRFGWFQPGDGTWINQQIPMWFGADAERRINRGIEREMANRLKKELTATKQQIASSEAELRIRKRFLHDWEIALKKQKANIAKTGGHSLRILPHRNNK